jgi:hypothetical protein
MNAFMIFSLQFVDRSERNASSSIDLIEGAESAQCKQSKERAEQRTNDARSTSLILPTQLLASATAFAEGHSLPPSEISR